MAFQISKFAARVSVSVLTRFLEKQKFAGNSPPCARRGVNVAARSEKFSSTCSATSKWREWQRVRVSRGGFSGIRSVTVLLGAVGVSAAVLSSSAVCAMAARPPLDLDSDKSDWKEAKSEFLCCG